MRVETRQKPYAQKTRLKKLRSRIQSLHTLCPENSTQKLRSRIQSLHTLCPENSTKKLRSRIQSLHKDVGEPV